MCFVPVLYSSQWWKIIKLESVFSSEQFGLQGVQSAWFTIYTELRLKKKKTTIQNIFFAIIRKNEIQLFFFFTKCSQKLDNLFSPLISYTKRNK